MRALLHRRNSFAGIRPAQGNVAGGEPVEGQLGPRDVGAVRNASCGSAEREERLHLGLAHRVGVDPHVVDPALEEGVQTGVAAQVERTVELLAAVGHEEGVGTGEHVLAAQVDRRRVRGDDHDHQRPDPGG